MKDKGTDILYTERHSQINKKKLLKYLNREKRDKGYKVSHQRRNKKLPNKIVN